jgi:type II secretion system protein N
MVAINRQNLLSWSGYAMFFVVCFVLSAYFSFPYERVRDLLVTKVVSSGAPGQKLSIGALGPHWLTGVTLTAVKLDRVASTPGTAASSIAIDKLTVSASPLALLFGGLGLRFDAHVGKGEIEGRYDSKKDGPAHTQAELDAFDLGKLGLGSVIGMPLAGAVSGSVDVALSDQTAETQGSVDLRIEGLRIGDGKAKLQIPGMGGLTLETIDAGTLQLKLAVKEGVATIERLEAKGKDLELSGSGSVRLVRELAQSRADITLAIKFERAYTQRSDRTKAMFDLLGANPLIKRATDADGKIRFTLAGTLENLRSAPAGPGAAPVGKRAGRGKRGE